MLHPDNVGERVARCGNQPISVGPNWRLAPMSDPPERQRRLAAGLRPIPARLAVYVLGRKFAGAGARRPACALSPPSGPIVVPRGAGDALGHLLHHGHRIHVLPLRRNLCAVFRAGKSHRPAASNQFLKGSTSDPQQPFGRETSPATGRRCDCATALIVLSSWVDTMALLFAV